MLNVWCKEVIIETTNGKFYMNRAYYDAHVRRKRIVMPILCGVILGVIILATIYLWRCMCLVLYYIYADIATILRFAIKISTH